MKTYKLAIRDLVPAPDPGPRSLTIPERSHAAAQAALRRKYKSFVSEVSLSTQFEVAGELYLVQGRLDGLRRLKKGWCLYEIKPVTGNPRHWLHSPELLQACWQLILYCDLFLNAGSAYQGSIEKAVLLLVGDDGRTCDVPVDISASSGAIKRRLYAIHKQQETHRSAFRSLQSIESVFERDRRTDRPLQVLAEREILDSPITDRILLTLPPGAGKTRLALRSALRSSLAHQLQIVWITAKATGRRTVIEELERLQTLGLAISHCWKTTAERLCNCDTPGADCPIRILTQTALFFGELNSENLTNPADRWCPFQIQQSLQQHANVIVADVNYLLNASSLSQRPFVVVIDEVQHFINRVLEHCRIKISRRQLKQQINKLPSTRKARFSELVDPEWLDEELLTNNSQLWFELADELRHGDLIDEQAIWILRLAALLADDSEAYSVVWYSTDSDSGWIGILTDPELFVQRVLERFPAIIALSGSLPADTETVRTLLPGFNDFEIVSPAQQQRHLTAIIPALDFRFPVKHEDISHAVSLLTSLHEAFPGTIAVFTQNRESSTLLETALRVRGYVSLLDVDIDTEWSAVAAFKPDFVLIPLGSSLSESVNPPQGLFSGAVVLAPGHAPPDRLLEHCTQSTIADSLYLQSVRESGSRIIQAAGRVNRSPDAVVPVFLLNQAFVKPEFMSLWPRSWFPDEQDIIFKTIADAVSHFRTLMNESVPDNK